MQTIKQVLFKGTSRANEKSPFIIAEMSGNHGASLEQALAIVDAAALTGVDALKIQTFTPDSMTIDMDGDDFIVTNKSSLWYGRKLYDLFKEAQTPYEWHEEIFQRSKEKGMLCFSTPFDEAAVDFLESLDAPAYKIASFDNVNIPLIKYAAKTGKPLIVSMGMANVGEIAEAVEAARSAGCEQLTVLKCTTSYPAPPERSNLRTIPHMAELFNCQVGLSDHTLGIGAAIAATTLGASVIEKHFTLSRDNGAVDSAFSLEPHEFSSLVNETKVAAAALGEVTYEATDVEVASRQKRRSIYVVKDIKKGEAFTVDNIRRIRPGAGLHPRYFEDIIGKVSGKAISMGSPLDWSCVGSDDAMSVLASFQTEKK